MAITTFQDAVNAVLFYLDSYPTHGDAKPPYAVICHGFLPTTVSWESYTQSQRKHVMQCWDHVWTFALKADEYRVATPAADRSVRHLVRRYEGVWEVLDFRTNQTPAFVMKRDRLVRDTMRATRRRVDVAQKVEGRSIFFHSRPDVTLLPAFSTIRLE